MNKKGVGIIPGIIALVSSITMITIIAFVLGTLLDTFLYNFQDVTTTVSPEFAPAMDAVMKLGEMFYTIITIILLLVTVWFFKGIIERHRYTRWEEEEW